MGKFVGGLIVGLVIIPMAVYLYFSTGMAPVATSASPMPFERMFARMALHAGMGKAGSQTPPIAADESAYLAGAGVYKEHCAVCHGLPLTHETAIAKGMYPHPPKLMEGTGVTDDPAGETYWKVSGGIRMTGMPSFSSTLSTTQMWQVSLLLANADKLPQSAKDSLVSATPNNSAPTSTPSLPTQPTPPPPEIKK
jgi:mono/diheme cytochrome c family protein